MDLFDVLSMIGGLAFLLYGMQTLGASLEKLTGGKLEGILERMTANRAKAVLFGALVTAAVQSSSTTTVMVVGFVNSGIMQLKQAVGIIMGANVGTTVTSWILSLSGLEGSGVLSLLKPSVFSPVLAAVGIVLLMFTGEEKKKGVGTILLSFAVLMLGMETMSGAVSGLAEVEGFRGLLLRFTNPFLGMLAGMLLTAAIQSSAASIGILQAFCASGALTYGAVIPIVLGQNIGTCVTAVLSGIGASRNAKRTAAVHLYFNLIGTLVFLAGFYLLHAVIGFPFLSVTADAGHIALIHSVFNIASTLLLFPFAGGLEKLAILTIRDKAEPKWEEEGKKNGKEFQILDERFLESPGFAMEQCRNVAAEMANLSKRALSMGIGLLSSYSEEEAKELARIEDLVDRYEDGLGTYLVRLSGRDLPQKDSNTVSKLLHCISDFERISDHAVNLMETAGELRERGEAFSEQAAGELEVFTEAVRDIVDLTVDVFVREDAERAKRVEPLEEVIDRLNRDIRSRHVKRLRRGECAVESGFLLLDILSNYERVSDHCSNIAICTIRMHKDVLDAHEYLGELRNERDEAFLRDYRQAEQRYRLPK